MHLNLLSGRGPRRLGRYGSVRRHSEDPTHSFHETLRFLVAQRVLYLIAAHSEREACAHPRKSTRAIFPQRFLDTLLWFGLPSAFSILYYGLAFSYFNPQKLGV